MFEALLLAIDRVFREADIGYMIIGGQALVRYAEPRMTKDIDVTLAVGPDEFDRVSEALARAGCTPLAGEDFVRRTLVLPAQHVESGIRVDVIFSFSPYEADAIRRAVELPVGSGAVRFATVEDLVVQKVVAGRPRDLEDVKQLVIRNPELDRDYALRMLKDFSEVAGADLVARFSTCSRKI